MTDVVSRRRMVAPSLSLTLLLGGAAGLLAVALLITGTPARAALALAALGGGALILSAPHLGLYLLTAAMIAQWPFEAIKLVGMAVTGSTLLWALATRRRLIPRDPLLLVLTLLIGVIWLSTLKVGLRANLGVALSWTSYLALYWTMSTLATSGRVVQRLVTAMLVSGVVIALIAFIQFKHPFVWIVSTSLLYNPYLQANTSLAEWDGSTRVESLAGTPDYLGLSMQVLIPLIAFWTLRQTSSLRRVVGWAALGAIVGGMLLSLTRGVMVVTLLIVVPSLAARLGWRRAVPFLAVGSLVALIALASFEPLRVRVLSITSEWLVGDASTAGGWRREVIPIALRMFFDYFWTGVGLQQHQTLWRIYAPSSIALPGFTLPIHNAYLVVAVELGIGGLSLVVLLVVMAWRHVRVAQAHFRATQQAALLDLASAVEIAWVMQAFTILLYPALNTSYRYCWVVLAVIGALTRIAADQRAAAAEATRA